MKSEIDAYLKTICFSGSNPDEVMERLIEQFPGTETKGLWDHVVNFIEYEKEKQF